MPRKSWGLALVVWTSVVSCTPVIVVEDVTSSRTTVTVTRTDPTETSAPGAPRATPAPAPPVPPTANVAATALTPPASPTLGAANVLVATTTADADLALPTALATTKSNLFAFGRTPGGWLVRALPTKAKASWSPPAVVAPARDDDGAPFAINDGELAWFGVSSESSGTRIARVDATTAAPRVTLQTKLPAKLGRVVSFVPLKAHIAVIGRDGDAITFARLDRATGFLDATARVIARGSASPANSRSPRATNEDEKVLLAWDGEDVPGALDAPGTTAAERASPKTGIYVRRFTPTGEPASPARRLTRPSIEAHALDVVVELGACAVLARTSEGFDMFRFVRKGDQLDPYGKGLHLGGPGGDVALGADVIGTIAVTSARLLRVGPGIKIVSSALGFNAPGGASFDEVRIAMDGYGAHVLFNTHTPMGPLPTIARIDGEHMGPIVPTPWSGPPPQRLAFAALDGDEGLALVVGGGGVTAARFAADGAPRASAPLPLETADVAAVSWKNAPVPRAARGGGEWVLSLRDARVLVATGPRAGSFVSLPAPKEAPPAGAIALIPSAKSATVRAVYVPPIDREAALWTATIDPKQATATAWKRIPGTERHYGALGGARFAAIARASGDLVLLTSSGPKVSSVAQLYGLMVVDAQGNAGELPIEAPMPIQELSLVPTLGGAAMVATLTGRGPATRWLEGTTAGWREAFAYQPFRARGDGPIIREKGAALVLPNGALPVELGGEAAPFASDRCPQAFVTGPRSLLLVCEEGAGDAPLSARVTTRTLRL